MCQAYTGETPAGTVYFQGGRLTRLKDVARVELGAQTDS